MTEHIHEWFGLSRANYLTVPRSVLQSMPEEWQRRFVELLHELSGACAAHNIDLPDTRVVITDERGRFIANYLADYDSGRRNVFAEQPQPATQDVFAEART